MKKYIEPKTTQIEVKCESFIAASLKGDGLNVTINNTNVTGDADAREGDMIETSGSVWGEEE